MSNTLKGRIFGTVTVGERGQVVIPADIRKRFKIAAGDKLIVLAKPGMVGLIPTEQFTQFWTQANEMMEKIKK